MAVEFTKDDVYEGLKNVYDPEIGINVVDLGLVYDADIDETGDVLVTMTLTSLGCPLGPVIMQEVNNALRDLPGGFRPILPGRALPGHGHASLLEQRPGEARVPGLLTVAETTEDAAERRVGAG